MIIFMHCGIRVDKTRQHSCSLHIFDIVEMPPTLDVVRGTIKNSSAHSSEAPQASSEKLKIKN